MSVMDKLLVAVVISAIAVGAYLLWEESIRRDERQQVNAKWEKAQAISEMRWATRLQSAQAKASQDLVELRNLHAQNLSSIRLRLDDTLRQLRDRPTRAAAQAAGNQGSDSSPTSVCTGDRLAGEDAEFLAREAARAAEQQEELRAALGAYEACRGTLQSVTGGERGQSAEVGGTP